MEFLRKNVMLCFYITIFKLFFFPQQQAYNTNIISSLFNVYLSIMENAMFIFPFCYSRDIKLLKKQQHIIAQFLTKSWSTFRCLLYTLTAVSGKSYNRTNLRYLGQILWCCVIGRALKALSKVLLVFVILLLSTRNWQ